MTREWVSFAMRNEDSDNEERAEEGEKRIRGRKSTCKRLKWTRGKWRLEGDERGQ